MRSDWPSFLVCQVKKFSTVIKWPLQQPRKVLVKWLQNSGAPNENIVQNHFNITLLNVF